MLSKRFYRTTAPLFKSTPSGSVSTESLKVNLGIQPDADIQKIDVLKPLFKNVDATATTHTKTLFSEQESNPTVLTAEPINPKIVHREKLRSLRRQYQQEYIEQKALKEEAAQKLQQEKDALYEKFKADVARFKAEASSRFQDIAYDAELDTTTASEKEALAQQKQKQLDELEVKLKLQRYQNKLKTMEREKEHRLKHLVHLFHETKNFITYSNLEYKLTQAFVSPHWESTNLNQLMAAHSKNLREKEAMDREAELKNIMEPNDKTPDVHHLQDVFDLEFMEKEKEQRVKEVEQSVVQKSGVFEK